MPGVQTCRCLDAARDSGAGSAVVASLAIALFGVSLLRAAHRLDAANPGG
jgi:hypothetical protein